MMASEKARVLDKARQMVRLQWACVVAACGFLVLQVMLGGWWWSVSIACAVVVGVIAVVHFRYVREFERSLDAPASGRSARWKD
jgi:hypothetical protein